MTRAAALDSPQGMADRAILEAGWASEKLHRALPNIERIERHRYRTPPEVVMSARHAVEQAIHHLSLVVGYESGNRGPGGAA